MGDLELFCQTMQWACDHGGVGYDQDNRESFTNALLRGGPNLSSTRGTETDCSAMVLGCLRYAGFTVNGATYTGNMRPALTSAGWIWLPRNALSQRRRGDILLNTTHHTALFLGHNTLAEARIDERNKARGGQGGDQTDQETRTAPYRDYPWDGLLRWPASSTANAPAQANTPAVATTATGDGYGLVAVDGSWGPLTETRLARVMNAYALPTAFSYANLQRFLNSSIPPASLEQLTSKPQLSVDGDWGARTSRALQYWMWCNVPATEPGWGWCAGWSMPRFCDGQWGPASTAVLQSALNLSWAGTGALLQAPGNAT